MTNEIKKSSIKLDSRSIDSRQQRFKSSESRRTRFQFDDDQKRSMPSSLSYSSSMGSSFNVESKAQNFAFRKSLAFQDKGVKKRVQFRQKMKILDDTEDVTPNSFAYVDFDDILLAEDDDEDITQSVSLWGVSFEKLIRQSFTPIIFSNLQATDATSSIMNANLDDIVSQMKAATPEALIKSASQCPPLSVTPSLTDEKEKEESPKIQSAKKFMKIRLTVTEEIILYESNSLTVPSDGCDAAKIIETNARYKYLTIGKGKNRITCDAETQTINTLVKSRSANTDRLKQSNVGTFVSNYDMFDTYEDLGRHTECLKLDEEAKLEITTYTRNGKYDEDEDLSKSDNFKLSAMIVERMLAGNVFRENQRRFRNMIKPNPLDLTVTYKYELNILWRYKTIETIGKAVSCASWCHINGDLLAIGYGVYNFVSFADRMIGYVCIWSIKNPINPERLYRYNVPITALAFSKETPQLLAVGLYNGCIEILDMTEIEYTPIAKSQRLSSQGIEPVWAIKWINVGESEELLCASEDGLIIKYTLTNYPYLLGFRQIKLDKVEGILEGINVSSTKKKFLSAYSPPQALTLQIHPIKHEMYYVGTNEGCIHKCSTFCPQQHFGIVQVHSASVTSVEFSPVCSKVFLTSGSDGKIRIWIDDIYEPVIELTCSFEPIHSAVWCPTNSTIIVSNTRTSVQIWNIRLNISKPQSIHTVSQSPLTICKFTNCGRSLLIGDSFGTTFICALDKMPFPPHFQEKQLQVAIQKSLITKPELQHQVESIFKND